MKGSQQSLPLAIVRGKALDAMPHDLFIPPEALEVFLETFEGPLDLLLYLIKKQKLDVVDLPIQQITHQYLGYIEILTEARIELAADYLVMAATLAEIKSRLLLPKMAVDDAEEEDPRVRLIKQLKAYEVVKQAAYDLDALPRLARDVFQAKVVAHKGIKPMLVDPDVSLVELATAFGHVLARIEANEEHHIQREHLSTRERMSDILAKLTGNEFVVFGQLFDISEGKAGVVVTFLALMELLKVSLVEVVQAKPYAEIYVKASG